MGATPDVRAERISVTFDGGGASSFGTQAAIAQASGAASTARSRGPAFLWNVTWPKTPDAARCSPRIVSSPPRTLPAMYPARHQPVNHQLRVCGVTSDPLFGNGRDPR